MKTAIVTYLLSIVLSSSALAKTYTCREAIDNQDSHNYSGVLKPNGITLILTTETDVCIEPVTTVQMTMQKNNRVRNFEAQVKVKPDNTQGYWGGFKARHFELGFGVLPPYLETNENKRYAGGDLDIGNQTYLMFCDEDIISVVDSSQCEEE
jgi:hypothetical protein